MHASATPKPIDRASVRFRRARILGLALLLAAIARPPADGRPTAVAQGTDPQLDVWIHQSIVGIKTAATNHPRLRLFDAEGRLRAQVSAGGQWGGGRWQLDLSAGRPVEQRVHTEPGDLLEVEIDGALTRIEVPVITASADAALDRVQGELPPGMLAVFVALHRDTNILEGPADITPKSGIPDLERRYSVDFRGEVDLGPGVWGEVAAVARAGHVFVQPFALPMVSLDAAAAIALLRADPQVGDLRLVSRNNLGADLFASGPAYALGGSLYAVPLLPGGLPENGVYRPAPGEALVIVTPRGELPVGPVPRLLVGLDGDGLRAYGHADAAARLAISLDRDGDGQADENAVTTAAADGSFAQAFAPALQRQAKARILAWAGRGVARLETAVLPELLVRLYGHVVTGSLAGWGRVKVEHLDTVGRQLAWTEVETDPAGFLLAELRSGRGQNSAFRPGERLRLSPAIGEVLDLVVPLVSAAVDAPGGRQLSGEAPAGARLDSAVYHSAPDFFGPQPFQEDNLLLSGQAGADGRYRLTCGAPPCAMYYGLLAAHHGPAAWILEWVDQPIVGIGVSDRTSLGRATAGQPVRLSLVEGAGQERLLAEDLVRPQINGQLPQWLMDLSTALPDGVAAGQSLRLEVGERRYDFLVPALSFSADNRDDTVRGKAPPLKALVAAGFARGDLQGRAPAGNATTLSGLTGDFQTSLGGFDLRAGDDVEVYLFEGLDRFLWWSERGIPSLGPEPVRPTPSPPAASPSPSAGRTPSPSPGRPTDAAPATRRLSLPRLGR